MNYSFFNCESLSSLPDISKWNTNNVFDINFLFSNCISLVSLPDITKWNNTDKNKNIIWMFKNCFSLLWKDKDVFNKYSSYNKLNNIPSKSENKLITECIGVSKKSFNKNNINKNIIKGLLDIKLDEINNNIILFNTENIYNIEVYLTI